MPSTRWPSTAVGVSPASAQQAYVAAPRGAAVWILSGFDAALLGAGIDVAIGKDARLGLSYETRFGDGTQRDGARVDFSLVF